MTDLVTGGAGFIGGRVVERLRRDGAAVRVLDLDGEAALPESVERIVGSAADPETVRQAMEGARRVFHVAGNPGSGPAKPTTSLPPMSRPPKRCSTRRRGPAWSVSS